MITKFISVTSQALEPPPSVTNCSNRKLNITLNFRFHMYDNKFISVNSHALDPLSQTVTPSRIPPPSSVTYFMDGSFSE